MVVAIAIFAWIAISNHCAFSAIATTAKAAESACPFHSKPPQPKQQPVGIQCCKILRAVVPNAAKSWARNDSGFHNVDLPCEAFGGIPDPHNPSPLLLDTGPPEARTFAELILQRSLLAHAPPLLV